MTKEFTNVAQSSKKLLLFGAAVALMGSGLMAGAARADVVLTPGSGATLLNAAELPNNLTLVAANTRTSAGNPTVTGSLTEAVYQDPAANGGAGGLDFVFQLTNTSAATNVVSFNTAAYGFPPTFTTSAGNFVPSPAGAGFVVGTVSPTTSSRDLSGSTVTFDGFTLAPGQTTTTFFVRTNAQSYNAFGTSSIAGPVIGGINPGSATFLNTFEPTVVTPAGVPEPATFGMAATAGVIGLGYAARRRMRASA